MKRLKIFLDSSVVLAGLASSNGGSRRILQLAQKETITLVVSTYIVDEIVNHLSKLHLQWDDWHNWHVKSAIEVVDLSNNKNLPKLAGKLNDPDDAHVLLGAIVANADILVSLDKKHILTEEIRKKMKPVTVMNTKEFWDWWIDREQ